MCCVRQESFAGGFEATAAVYWQVISDNLDYTHARSRASF